MYKNTMEKYRSLLSCRDYKIAKGLVVPSQAVNYLYTYYTEELIRQLSFKATFILETSQKTD